MIFGRPVEQLLQLIQSGLGLVVILGWIHLTPEQMGAAMVFVGTFLAWWTGATVNKVLATAERLNEAKNAEIAAVEAAKGAAR